MHLSIEYGYVFNFKELSPLFLCLCVSNMCLYILYIFDTEYHCFILIAYTMVGVQLRSMAHGRNQLKYELNNIIQVIKAPIGVSLLI